MTSGEVARRPLGPHVLWHWATPQAQAVLDTRDLGAILRFYRTMHGVNQSELGALLGYDKTYISLLELGRRTLGDTDARAGRLFKGAVDYGCASAEAFLSDAAAGCGPAEVAVRDERDVPGQRGPLLRGHHGREICDCGDLSCHPLTAAKTGPATTAPATAPATV